jgi:Predicted aminoglycoside phosphotransferase
MENLQKILSEIIADFIPDFKSIEDISRLSGGSSNETWKITLNTKENKKKIVFRRTPGGNLKDEESNNFVDIADEAKVMNIANDYNVPVPKIIKVINNNNIGKGFFMDFIEGETLGNRIVNSDKFKIIRPRLAKKCGEIIANIHKIPISKFDNIKTSEAEDELLKYEEVYRIHNQDIPVFEYTISWLKDNIPKKITKKLIHGDFRNGNLIISNDNLIPGVLDWELFHLGDPYEDLSWICVNSWRFNKIELPVGGFGEREDMYISYEKVLGKKLDRER